LTRFNAVRAPPGNWVSHPPSTRPPRSIAPKPRRLESGALVRLLPDWHQEMGAISLYFTSQKLLPAKTRAFVDFVTEEWRSQGLAQRFSATHGRTA